MREPFRLSVRCSSSPACPTSRLNKSEAPLSLALGRLRKLDKGPGGRLLAERGPSCPVHRRSRKYLRRIPPPGPYPGRVCEPNKIKIQKSPDNGTGAPGAAGRGTYTLTHAGPTGTRCVAASTDDTPDTTRRKQGSVVGHTQYDSDSAGWPGRLMLQPNRGPPPPTYLTGSSVASPAHWLCCGKRHSHH